MIAPLPKAERGLRKPRLAKFLQKLIGISTQQFNGFRTFGAQHNAEIVAVLLDLKFDVAQFFGLQKHIDAAGSGGGAVMQKLRCDSRWALRCMVQRWGDLVQHFAGGLICWWHRQGVRLQQIRAGICKAVCGGLHCRDALRGICAGQSARHVSANGLPLRGIAVQDGLPRGFCGRDPRWAGFGRGWLRGLLWQVWVWRV